MSDILKVPAATIVSSINKWEPGELPDAKKFTNLFAAFESSFAVISQVLGPLLDSNTLVTSKDKIISSSSIYKTMSPAEQLNWYVTLSDQILNTFNLSRIIGPHAALNPQYLPGSSHVKASQGSGYPLATDRKVQQLPFPPQPGYSATLVGETGWSLASSKEEAQSSISKKYFIDESGVLYSSRTFASDSYLKYDLYIPNTYSYFDAGYNCIPDISILSLTEEARTGALGGDYGLVKVTAYSSTSDSSTWRVEFPKVISVNDPLLSQATRQISNNGFEPVGKWESATSAKWYTLEDQDFYKESFIDKNLLSLFNKETGETFILNWQVDPDAVDVVKRTYLVTGPPNLVTKFYQNDHTSLLSLGGSNSRDFFVFALSSTVTEQLAQLSLNYSKHKHNGVDSYKVSHKDLLDAEGNKQGLGVQTGANGGLDFVNLNRQLAYSDAQDNVHPQYLHRLGFAYGGTAGRHEVAANVDKILDLNMLYGDLVLGPIENEALPDTYSYKYASAGAATSAPQESINWTLTSSDVATSLDVLDEKRSHSLVFGIPSITNGVFYGPWYGGSTRLYFEPHVFDTDTKYDKKALLYTLSRHGFIPGEVTNRKNYSKNNHIKGLNITYGNMFFGYREDLFGGLLAATGLEETESSAYFRTAEFNIVTTANDKSGQNTNSKIKEGYNYRDGFAVRALKGSNIWLSTGAESEDLGQISSGKNTDGVPGTIAIEASYPSSRSTVFGSETGVLSLNTLISSDLSGDTIASGSGIFLAPGPTIDVAGVDQYRNPWVASTIDDYKFAALWDSSSLGPVVTGNLLDGPAFGGPGPLLDIFALAPDRQKANILSNGDISTGKDNSLRGWVFGRPFIRGTYGINFCTNGDFYNIDQVFKTGYHREEDNENWGPVSPILDNGDNEYIHREFRFWGKNVNTPPSPSLVSLQNTVGGNINMLYNFGRNYTRFGQNLTWNNGVGPLSGDTDRSPWANSRRISLGAKLPEEYGSAIRQASYVEAFSGFRNDPLQPYTVDYVYPFYAYYDTGITAATLESSGIDIQAVIKKSTFIIADQIDSGTVTTNYFDVAERDNYKLFTSFNKFNDVTFDSLLRGSEDLLIKRSDTVTGGFPRALASYKVKLNYFMGKLITGSTGGGNADSPHTSGKGYSRIGAGTVEMVDPYKVVMSAAGAGNKAPIIASDSHYDAINLDSNINSTVSYSSSIGLLPNQSDQMSTYRDKFPDFETKYSSLMGNKQFCLFLNIHDRTSESYLLNSPVPYRIFIDGDKVYISVSGTVTFKMISAYHTAPIY
jgi:hypothetical protein